MKSLLFRMFEPGDEAAFRQLNEAWIRQYFAIEPKDVEVLGDPTRHILGHGGEIVMAIQDGKPVGCCALLAMPDRCFEIGKMAVAEECRGQGIGRGLLTHAIDRGRERGAKRLYLETSTKLPSAIHLYESQGFRYLPPERVQPSPYTRSDLFMEMFLE
jgi:GNAT superfamily N-acetyltransferase